MNMVKTKFYKLKKSTPLLDLFADLRFFGGTIAICLAAGSGER